MWKYRLTRLLLFLIFSSYLIVMVLSNSDRILLSTNLLEKFGWKKVEKISEGLYYGSYADKQTLENYGIKTLVSTLSPSLPVSRELFKSQKKLCHHLGIRFVSLPLELRPTPESPGFQNLLRFLRSSPKRPVYISSFRFDPELFKMLKSAQIMQDQTLKGR